MIGYRDAAAADAPAIGALFRDSFTATFGHLYDPADLADFLAGFTIAAWVAEITDPDYRFRLAEEDGALLGYAKISSITLPVTPQGRALELRQLYLAERTKGTGVAATLMGWVLATAGERGAREIFLSVFVDNHRARRFYQRYGFEDIGPYWFPVGKHLDEDRLMRRVL